MTGAVCDSKMQGEAGQVRRVVHWCVPALPGRSQSRAPLDAEDCFRGEGTADPGGIEPSQRSLHPNSLLGSLAVTYPSGWKLCRGCWWLHRAGGAHILSREIFPRGRRSTIPSPLAGRRTSRTTSRSSRSRAPRGSPPGPKCSSSNPPRSPTASTPSAGLPSARYPKP